MIFSLDVRRARKGDCLILHYGTPQDPGIILIDGGPSQVWKPQLKPRLDRIRAERNIPDDGSLPIDLLMVSHIDDDHINGILELTGELVTAFDSHQPLPLKVRQFWHNSFDDIIGNKPTELLASITAAFGAASSAALVNADGLDPAVAKVLASVDQGIHLRDDVKKLGLPLNKAFNGDLVRADPHAVDLGKGLKLVVAGPSKPQLLKLQADHDKFLKKNKKGKASPAAFTDNSVANLSSIVALADADNKRVLLTGDARGDMILQGLESVKLIPKNGKMHVDILKVPHHGSDRDMETVFFERVTADHYVFSGNGEHGNPERKTLQMLLDARGNDNLIIHLTYPIVEIDKARKAEWNKQRAREKTKAKTKVREKWSDKKHSLVSFFDSNKEFAKKVRVVEQAAPHVIDLADPLGF